MRDDMSPSELYLKSRGTFPNDRVAALFAEADRVHERAKADTHKTPEQWMAERDEEIARERAAAEELAEQTRPATAAEYAAWLDGFIAAGGRPTHAYDYPFTQIQFVVATGSTLYVPDLHGALSASVIVPAACRATLAEGHHGRPGHCDVYFMDGFRHIGWAIPTYTDVRGQHAE